MHRDWTARRDPSLAGREEWPFVRRIVLTIACIHVLALLAIGAVVWQSDARLEPRATLSVLR